MIEGRRIVERIVPDAQRLRSRRAVSSLLASTRWRWREAENERRREGQGWSSASITAIPIIPPARANTTARIAWPFYSYVIVAIDKREPAAMTCWVLNEDNGAVCTGDQTR